MLKVVVIGSGNVAQHLITVFGKSSTIHLVQVYARNVDVLAHLVPKEKITDDFNTLEEADIYIISITDGSIPEVSALLPFSGKLVVHTSGSVALEQINNKNRRGVFYPLQTFSKNKAIDFKQVPLCLESEKEADYTILETLAQSISNSVYNINSQQRKSLHVAAVFVSNFANYMYSIGYDICEQNNVPFDILKPLIQETAEKVQTLSPKQAQTGPARRNDITTMEKHLAFLTDEKIKTIYTLLSQSIQNNNE
ncbi:DUF2520 domain-containing protein [Flavobacterium arcticum]|uniref:DUF2520 domain-containing protein n=1 Tax=Flavobacterium arcticum TaxID=1784713 RepID=A0A345HDM9_9FLAO|nr:Rossmann-like and DUF2520 domain-containing protein [Flavobacterium arcticum]AXG74689.1 DUF2520 domain-containing protein [Flavobacterium arcticum]KAF2512184.1 DUF2520 domain-containing protein [Flavobacterium arcticum]